MVGDRLGRFLRKRDDPTADIGRGIERLQRDLSNCEDRLADCLHREGTSLDGYAENVRLAERERIAHGIRKYLGRLIWSEEDIDLLLRHSDVGLVEKVSS